MARGDVAFSLRGIEASLLRGLIGVRPRHTSEGDTMSSSMRRLGLVASVVILLAGAIALAQDRRAGDRVGGGIAAVFNPVEGRAVVVSSRPDGARVDNGDIVCELDPTDLKDRLATQEIVVRGAEADVHGARIAHEVAVMAVVEYRDATLKGDLAAAQAEIKLAESDLSRAEDKLDWSRRMFQKGYVSLAEKNTEEFAIKRVQLGLEEAQSKLKVLVDYSKERTIKVLLGGVETARARELAKQAELEQARSAERSLAHQIARCKVAAPAGGRLEHAAPIGPGAVIHDGQLLFRVVPAGAVDSKTK